MNERERIAGALACEGTSDDLWKPIIRPVLWYVLWYFGMWSHTTYRIRTLSAQPFLRYRKWVCTCAPAPHAVRGNPLAYWSSTTHNILAQSAEPFLKYGNGVSTCARAHVPPPSSWVHLSWWISGHHHQISARSVKPFPSYSRVAETVT